MAGELEALDVTLAARAHDGKLFGSITERDVADAIRAAGGPLIEKRSIELPGGHIKDVGSVLAQVRLHPDVTARSASPWWPPDARRSCPGEGPDDRHDRPAPRRFSGLAGLAQGSGADVSESLGITRRARRGISVPTMWEVKSLVRVRS